MPDVTTILNIDLLATTMRDFVGHFVKSFCHITTFKPYLPELLWVKATNGPFDSFGWRDRNSKMTDDERERDIGISFEFFEWYKLQRKPIVPYASWEIQGYGGKGTPASQISCALTITRYRTDRLRIVGQELRNESWTPAAHDSNMKLLDIFLEWLDARWSGIDEQDKGYITYPPENAPLPPRDDPLPLLPVRATKEMWFNWFDRYYRRGWGAVPNKMEHMESLNGKSVSQNEKMHSLYMADKRY